MIDSFLFVHLGSGDAFNKTTELASPTAVASHRLTGIAVDKSVEFSYEELARATDDFSLANKIGQGGFGAVYYAELRGEVCIYDLPIKGKEILILYYCGILCILTL